MKEQTIADQLTGLQTEWRKLDYNWRDVALYALAVGAREPVYTCEAGLKAIPTFGVIPYWGTVNVTPPIPKPMPTPVLAEELLRPEQSFVNLDYELSLHQPIDPMKGSFVYRDEVKAVYDRGPGRGAALRSELVVCDEGGNALCTNRCTTLFPTLGGLGGPPMPSPEVTIPEREPDHIVSAHVEAGQHLLYRLTGDTNRVHYDDAYARSRGLQGAFVHDLCIFGYACRLGIEALFPKAPERLSRIAANMKSIVYPDTPIALQLWKEAGQTRAVFRVVNECTGKTVLDRGILEWS